MQNAIYAQRSIKIKKTAGDRVFDFIIHRAFDRRSAVILYPLWQVVFSSFQTPASYGHGHVVLTPSGYLESYKEIFRLRQAWTGFRNTIFYTVDGTCISLIATLDGGYVPPAGFWARAWSISNFSLQCLFNGG